MDIADSADARHARLSAAQVTALQMCLICVLGSLFGNFSWGMSTLGPAFMWAWVVGGILQIGVAVSVAGLSAAYPLTGGCYRWLRELGRHRLARFTGFLLLAGYLAAVADDDSGFAGALLSFAGVHNPRAAALIATMLACLLAQTALCLVSIWRVARATIAAAVIQTALIVVIVIALIAVGTHQPGAILWRVAGTAEHEHMPTFLLMLMIPAWTLTGFDTPVNFAGETRDPRRAIPHALLIATVLSFLLGTALLAMALLAMPGQQIAGAPASIPFILAARLGSGFAQTAIIVELLTLFFLPVVVQLVAARMLWAQARDGVWSGRFGESGARGVPVGATLLCAAIAAVLCLGWSVAYGLGTVWPALWALSYGITIAAFLAARLKDQRHAGRDKASRPESAWTPGRLGVANALLAATWCAFLTVLLPLFDALHAVPLLLVIVVIGLLVSGAGVGLTRTNRRRGRPIGEAGRGTGPRRS